MAESRRNEINNEIMKKTIKNIFNKIKGVANKKTSSVGPGGPLPKDYKYSGKCGPL